MKGSRSRQPRTCCLVSASLSSMVAASWSQLLAWAAAALLSSASCAATDCRKLASCGWRAASCSAIQLRDVSCILVTSPATRPVTLAAAQTSILQSSPIYSYITFNVRLVDRQLVQPLLQRGHVGHRLQDPLLLGLGAGHLPPGLGLYLIQPVGELLDLAETIKHVINYLLLHFIV